MKWKRHEKQQGYNMAIIIVQKGIRDIPYYLYEPIKRKRVIKAKQGEHETISLQALSLCICVCVHIFVQSYL